MAIGGTYRFAASGY